MGVPVPSCSRSMISGQNPRGAPQKRQPFAITQPAQKHGDKGYFDQNNAVLTPNGRQYVQKAYIIAN